MKNAYQELEQRFRRVNLLRQAVGMLQWDQSVTMPPGGANARGAQLAELKVIIHEIVTDRRTEQLLLDVDISRLGSWQAANVREMRHIWSHANAVPRDLIAARSKACTACEMKWRTARASTQYKQVLPDFKNVVDLTREVAEAKASALNVSAYDTLFGQYAPGMTIDEIDPIFDDYLSFLPNFLERVVARQAAGPPPPELKGPFELEAQRQVARHLAEIVGLDFASARLDESEHPFSGGVPDDSRITARYSKDNFSEAMMAVLHETGHAMYERGRPSEWHEQPVGCSRGMVIHESQSLIVEMQACRSREFFEWAAPMFAHAFGGTGSAWGADEFYKRATAVRPSLIRIDADEVTYPAHIILRTELERALLAGDLLPVDLPGAWNEKILQLLDVSPSNDAEGCLQDIHWYDGAWGYFPTYTLGAMAAAQIFKAAVGENPMILDSITDGEFRPLMRWLLTNIHEHGCLFATQDLLIRATGRKLDPEAFKSHLHERYLS
ncbi:MAG: carboxypeptidase M32 [Rhodospirillaceae bacterium]|nr:carboxypeptidase M32 [Rhodospirillaceae bacterium]